MAEDSSATSQFPTVTNNPSLIEKTLVFINVAAQAPLHLALDNYMVWHSQWYSLLIEYDIMGYVDGTTACPPPSDAHHHFWIRQDHLLRSALIASLTLDLVNFIATTQSSHETWQKLATMYAKPSRGRIMGLRETLSKTIKDSRTIIEYMQAINRIADSLSLAGEPLRSDEVVFHVLNGLGNDYKEISAALRARDTSITFAELHDKLADYEAFLNRNKTAQISSFPATAKYTNRGEKSSGSEGSQSSTGSASSNSSKSATRSTSKVICQFCDIPGHSARTCRKIFAAAPWLNGQLVSHWSPYYQQASQPSLLGPPPRPSSSHPRAHYAAPSSPWLFGSSASHHVTSDLQNLSLHSEYEGPDDIIIGDGKSLSISHTGNGSLSFQ